MSLWDALTGKIHLWNAMRAEAHERVRIALRPFISSRLRDYPNHREYFANARSSLFAYFQSAAEGISRNLDTEFQSHKGRIYSFNANLFLRFIAAFHATHVTMAYFEPEHESWLYLMSEGVEEMYGYPKEMMRSWWELVPQLREGHDGAVLWVGDHLREEITPILGLTATDHPQHSIYWLSIQGVFAEGMAGISRDPGWPAAVEAELGPS